jgi:hypothetical protein
MTPPAIDDLICAVFEHNHLRAPDALMPGASDLWRSCERPICSCRLISFATASSTMDSYSSVAWSGSSDLMMLSRMVLKRNPIKTASKSRQLSLSRFSWIPLVRQIVASVDDLADSTMACFLSVSFNMASTSCLSGERIEWIAVLVVR